MTVYKLERKHKSRKREREREQRRGSGSGRGGERWRSIDELQEAKRSTIAGEGPSPLPRARACAFPTICRRTAAHARDKLGDEEDEERWVGSSV